MVHGFIVRFMLDDDEVRLEQRLGDSSGNLVSCGVRRLGWAQWRLGFLFELCRIHGDVRSPTRWLHNMLYVGMVVTWNLVLT